MPAQGLSQSELIRTSVIYSPGLHHLTPPHSTGPSPSGWSFGPTSVAARWWRSGTFCSDPVREYLAPIRLLAPHRPEFRLRFISTPTVGWLQAGLCVPGCSPFRLRVSHYSSHTLPSDDTRPPWVTDALPHRVARTHLGATEWNP